MALPYVMDTMKAINIARIQVDMALPNVMDTMKAINIARIQVDNGIT